MTTHDAMDTEGSDQDRSPALDRAYLPDEPDPGPLPAILVAADRAEDVAAAVARLSRRATTWVLVLRSIDDGARRLKHALLATEHECLLIRADFRDRDQRLQVLAMARDFAGELDQMWDLTHSSACH